MRIPSLTLLSGMLCLASLAASPPSGKRTQEKLTLEQAFDRALASDQSIRIAFLEVQKADLLPLSALTRIAPRLNGSVGYTRSGSDLEIPGTSGVTRSRRGAGVETLSLDQPLVLTLPRPG